MRMIIPRRTITSSRVVCIGLILRHHLPALRGIGPRGIEQSNNIPAELNTFDWWTSIGGRTELKAVLSLEGAGITIVGTYIL